MNLSDDELEKVIQRFIPMRYVLIKQEYEKGLLEINRKKRVLLERAYDDYIKSSHYTDNSKTNVVNKTENNNTGNIDDLSALQKSLQEKQVGFSYITFDAQNKYKGAQVACLLIAISVSNTLASIYSSVKSKYFSSKNTGRVSKMSRELKNNMNNKDIWMASLEYAISDFNSWGGKYKRGDINFPHIGELKTLGLLDKYEDMQEVEEVAELANYSTVTKLIKNIATIAYNEQIMCGCIYTNNGYTSAILCLYLADFKDPRIWVFDSHGKIVPNKSAFATFMDNKSAAKFVVDSLSSGSYYTLDNSDGDTMHVDEEDKNASFLNSNNNENVFVQSDVVTFGGIIFKWK
jgi:hypothetical protein